MNQASYLSDVLKQKLTKLPFFFIFIISILCFYGIFVLYCAAGGNIQPWAYKQLVNFCIFMPLALLIAIIPLNFIFRYAYVPYLIVLLMLIAVEAFGYTAKGGTRWIELGALRIQPAEPAKIAIVLMLAKHFHQMTLDGITSFRKLLLPATALIIPVALIIKQPDLGTGTLTLMVGAAMFFAAGINRWIFVASFTAVAVFAPILWHFLYDYQKKRVLVFLNPELDPLGSGYNIIQSKIAIGSGGIFGKGIGEGTQNHLEFLPEHQTDFIFASLAEELGFAGGSLLLILYGLVIYVALSIAINARSSFAKLLTVGVASIFFFHAFINMAMVMGLLPVVGLPLPLISYGGTMMVSMLTGLGLIMNAHVNRHTIVGRNM